MMRERVRYRNRQGLDIRVFPSPGKSVQHSEARYALTSRSPPVPPPSSFGCALCPCPPCLTHGLPAQSTRAGVALLSLSLLLCSQVEMGRVWSEMWFLSGAVPVTGAVPVLGCCCRSAPGDAALWRCGCSLLPQQGWQTSALIYF